MIRAIDISESGVEVTVGAVSQKDFQVFNSKDTEVLVSIFLEEFGDWLKISPENFITISKHLRTWDFNSWVGSKLRIYRITKEIKGNLISIVKVGETL